MTNKIAYLKFLQRHALPVFFQDWWLDAVCEKGEWDVAIARKKDGQISGVLPYYLTTMRGQPVNIMPMLTPQLGAWIIYPPNLSLAKKYSYEKRVTEELMTQLPNSTYFVQNFPYRYQNGQPLYWLGYKSTARYSYLLHDLSDLNQVYDNFAGRLRTTLRKAEEVVTIEVSDDIERLYQINQLTFQRQNLAMPYSLDFIKKMDAAAAKHEQRTIYFATDKNGQTHAALYIVWDKQTSYNLIAGGDPKFRNSGAMQLLLWRAIQDAAERGHVFDFEGSMLEKVAFSFQSFGAELMPYLRVYKAKNRFWEVLWTLLGKE